MPQHSHAHTHIGEYIDEHNFERVIAKVQGVLGSKVC